MLLSVISIYTTQKYYYRADGVIGVLPANKRQAILVLVEVINGINVLKVSVIQPVY